MKLIKFGALIAFAAAILAAPLTVQAQCPSEKKCGKCCEEAKKAGKACDKCKKPEDKKS